MVSPTSDAMTFAPPRSHCGGLYRLAEGALCCCGGDRRGRRSGHEPVGGAGACRRPDGLQVLVVDFSFCDKVIDGAVDLGGNAQGGAQGGCRAAGLERLLHYVARGD